MGEEVEALDRLIAKLDDERDLLKDCSRIHGELSALDPMTAQLIANTMYSAARELESLRASLTRAEEDANRATNIAQRYQSVLAKLREQVLEGIEPFIRHGRSIENERNLRIWTDRGYREVPREDFDRLTALKARLSRENAPKGPADAG